MGPDHQWPAVESPPTWDLLLAGETNDTVRMNSTEIPEREWWRLFENEERNDRIEQALQQNHDVCRATIRVMEGCALTVSTELFPQLNAIGSYANVGISKNTLAELGLVSGTRSSPQTFATPGKSFDLYDTVMDLRWKLTQHQKPGPQRR